MFLSCGLTSWAVSATSLCLCLGILTRPFIWSNFYGLIGCLVVQAFVFFVQGFQLLFSRYPVVCSESFFTTILVPCFYDTWLQQLLIFCLPSSVSEYQWFTRCFVGNFLIHLAIIVYVFVKFPDNDFHLNSNITYVRNMLVAYWVTSAASRVPSDYVVGIPVLLGYMLAYFAAGHLRMTSANVLLCVSNLFLWYFLDHHSKQWKMKFPFVKSNNFYF